MLNDVSPYTSLSAINKIFYAKLIHFILLEIVSGKY